MPQPTEQDQLCREDLLWGGLSFPILNEEELAHDLAATGDKVHLHRGVSWVQVKPFFCLPCLLFSETDHRNSWPHPARALAGFMHLSAPNSPSNGIYRAIVRGRLDLYSIQRLSKERRHRLRRALKHLTVRPVESLDDLLTQGYEVYLSCHERVRWGKSRCDRQAFNAWIAAAFRRPKRLALGAYSANRLVAFMLPYAAANMVTPSYIASHTDALKYGPNDSLYHALLCIARQTPGLEMANFGPVSSDPLLDQFKMNYGSLTQFTSYTWINPLVRPMFNKWIRPRYPWLCGDATQASVNSENG
jgi:hypothetical protein